MNDTELNERYTKLCMDLVDIRDPQRQRDILKVIQQGFDNGTLVTPDEEID